MKADLSTSPGRLIWLDILRAVALLLVMFRHAGFLDRHSIHPWVDWLTDALMCGGWIGVDLFFVLSGFLVSGLLMREYQRKGNVRAGRFLFRRGMKIYPAMALFLLVTAVVYRLNEGHWQVKELIVQALFIQNYTPGTYIHLWSLAVEEHAYLIIAAAFAFCVWRSAKRGGSNPNPFTWVPWAVGLYALAALLMRLWVSSVDRPYFSSYVHVFPTHLRLDSLFFGVLIAYMYHFKSELFANWCHRLRVPMLVCGLALLIPPFFMVLRQERLIYTFGFSANYLGGGMLLCVCLTLKRPTSKVAAFFAAIGRHSYGIYLWHMAVNAMILYPIAEMVGGEALWWLMPSYFVLSIVMGVGLTILVEIPALKWRDRVSPSDSGELKPMGTTEAEEPRADAVLSSAMVGATPATR